MEPANAGSERRIYEAPALDFPVCLRVPSRPTEPCAHDQETDVPGLLKVWTGVWVFLGIDALPTVECYRPFLCTAEQHQARGSFGDLIRVSAHGHKSSFLDVSYLAQTRKPVRVILESPECVERATTADS